MGDFIRYFWLSCLAVCIWLWHERVLAELCLYEDSSGKLFQVSGKASVPAQYQERARCIKEKVSSKKSEEESKSAPRQAAGTKQSIQQSSKQGVMISGANPGYLAAPSEIDLPGSIRKERIVTSLGPLEMRWPRKVELLFGRSPHRAVADAIHTASRFVKQNTFPPELRSATLEWEVVFLDQELPETQIPQHLITNCHPAWMVAPARIYVVAQRVAHGCNQPQSGKPVSANDAQLTQILLHEIGHVIEQVILSIKDDSTGAIARPSLHEAERGEGFATWFEIKSSDLSSVIPRGTVRKERIRLAKDSLVANPTGAFNGTSHDYSRAAATFLAIEKSRGIDGIMRVYKSLRANPVPFRKAVQDALRWDQKKLAAETERYITEN